MIDRHSQITLLEGAISTFYVNTLTAPLERIKILIQTQDAHPAILNSSVKPYASISSTLYRITKEQGIASLWRGNLAGCLRFMPYQYLNLFIYDKLATNFPNTFWNNFLVGGITGSISLLAVYPFDFARTTLASEVSKPFRFKGVLETIKHQRVNVFQGFGVALLGSFWYRSVLFGLNQTWQDLNPSQDNSIKSWATKFTIAHISAIAASFCHYPFDTVTRRLQMQTLFNEKLYQDSFDCFKQIIKNEGYRGLFKGAGVDMIFCTGVAIILVTYGEIRTHFL
ncbi:hypothetical protein HK103_005699 [Boothiomyces macroporosus]|uniref:ADP/ATP translocase n=1 Tax=Boothiomyces macroporosus TaxID=261099 RepID=A0AAD5Y2J5_9FUNG|nr:hypothetical protein HK103_005699 [Boothiomyces macroporosus]